MANATSLRRRTPSAYVDEMAAEGRTPSVNSSGEIRGFRSRPGATQSARDSMVGLTDGVGARPALGGLSSGTQWNSFFRPSETAQSSAAQVGATAAKVGSMFAGMMTGTPSLAPSSPLSAPALASAMPKSPRTPEQYLQSAINSSEQWLDAAGAPRLAASNRNPATSGTSFANKYGTGSVLSGEDYRAKLRRMAGAQGFETSMI